MICFFMRTSDLIRNAKKHCDYLIVGVNADDLVESYKNKDRSFRWKKGQRLYGPSDNVDEVIVTTTLDKKQVWEKVHFNEIYIGDDWKAMHVGRRLEKKWKNWALSWYFCHIPKIHPQRCFVRIKRILGSQI